MDEVSVKHAQALVGETLNHNNQKEKKKRQFKMAAVKVGDLLGKQLMLSCS